MTRRTAQAADAVIASATAVAKMVTSTVPGASLLPSMDKLRAVSARVAMAVAIAAEIEGVATRKLGNPVQDIHDQMWTPDYPTIEVV